MKFPKWAGLALAAACVLISGCGDVFRPVATPLPLPSPDPQSFRLAVFTSCQLDPTTKVCLASGATSQVSDVNVSGDTVEGVVPVGHSPVFALIENFAGFSARITTVDFDNDTITQHSDTHSLTTPIVPNVSPATTIGLPQGAKPVSIANANGSFYVAESGRNVVAVLSGGPLALTKEIQVAANPVNLAVLPNQKKLYVVNQGAASVSVISTADNSVLSSVQVGSNPVWAVASADSSRVFVVNQGSNNVSVIDTTSDALTTTVTVGTAPNYAVFDGKNQRVLVTNPGSGTLSVISADSTAPTFLNVRNVTVGASPQSVTALADGSRVYVANTGSNSVSVINSLSLVVTKTVAVGSAPVWIASDSESSKVLTANRDSGNVSIINTSNDIEAVDVSGNPNRIFAPQVDLACLPSSTVTCPRLSPLFVGISG